MRCCIPDAVHRSAPQSLADDHPWIVDPCHLAPSACNAAGHLTRLALPVMGLACAAFPAQLGKLQALQRLDLTGNNLEGVSMDDVVKVRSEGSVVETVAV
jgi:hypothetical protein